MGTDKPRRKKKSKYRPVKDRQHSLIEVAQEFATEVQCLAFLEKVRWPEGVECIECGCKRISRFTAIGAVRKNRAREIVRSPTGEPVRSPDRHLLQCLNPACKHQFSAITGTVFQDTHLDLGKWFQAIAIMCDGKKGTSAMQIQRSLQIGSYKTAWYLNHRIREAMVDPDPKPLTGVIEADETYVGGKFDKRRNRDRWDKEPVFGMVERDGNVRMAHIQHITRSEVIAELKENISIEAEALYTDESPLYKRLPEGMPRHESVNHSVKEWTRGEVHTGTIDGVWSLVKRGIIGSFHRVSIKHLGRYLAEFETRWNHRRTADLFTIVIARLLIQSALGYKALIAEAKSYAPSASSESPEPQA